MATTKITPNQQTDYGLMTSLSRQAIINGNFDIWQRGTTLAINGIVILADRWKMYVNSTNEANTFSQADGTGVDGSQYCAKWQRTAGQTGTVGFQFGQSLETRDSIKFRNKKVTLSFWAKAGANYSASSGYLVSSIITGTGTDGEVILGFTGAATAATQNNVLTTSWQKFTLTTSAVIGVGINQIGIKFVDIPVGTAGADDSFYITQVQLCAGDVALPFMPNSYEEELRACQRCYISIGGSSAYEYLCNGHMTSTTSCSFIVYLPVKMRTIAAVTSTGNFQIMNGGAANTASAFFQGQRSSISPNFTFTTSAASTVGYACELRTANDLNARIMFNAEL